MMKYIDRKSLDRKRTYLIEHLDVVNIPDHLLENEVLNDTDLQRIGAENVPNEKCKLLLDIIKCKKPEAFAIFMKVLRVTKNDFIADELEKERKCLEEQETQLQYPEDIQQTLMETFEAEQDSSVSLNEIFDHIEQAFRAKGQLWKVDDLQEQGLIDLVQKIFQHVRIERFSPRKGLSSYKIRGLWLKKKPNESIGEMRNQEAECTGTMTKGTGQTVFSSMDKDDLHEWLKRTLKDLAIDESIADELFEAEFDGEVFENTTIDELKELITKFGHRKKLILARDKAIRENNLYGEPVDKVYNEKESTRRFETSSSISDKYRQRNSIQLEPRTSNLLRPVRYSYLPKSTESNDFFQEIATEVTNFSAACMNERTNGTMYIGVDSLQNGKIVGVQLPSDFSVNDVDKCIIAEIKKRFHEDQIKVALNCIRPPQMVGVITEGTSNISENHVVIEVDVVPNFHSTKYMTFFVKSSNKNASKVELFRLMDGTVKCVDSREQEQFMEEKFSISKRREDVEKMFSGSKVQSSLDKRLTDFLCCGGENIEPSIDPILVLGPLDEDMDDDYLQENFSNLKNVPWKAIFDFGNSSEIGLLRFMERNQNKVFLRKSVNDFNDKYNDKTLLNETFESIRESAIPTWIAADEGQDYKPVHTARLWKRQCKQSFLKILDFLEEEFTVDRIRVLILLFAKKSDVLTEASDELFLRFPHNCLVLATSKLVIHPYTANLKSRNCADSSVIDSCCIEGLPWKITNEIFARICDQDPKGEVMITRSFAPPCILPQGVLLSLCDLEVVGQNECENILKSIPEEEIENEKRNAAEGFYSGEEVKWQNFYHENHVLCRDKTVELASMIRSSLNACKAPSDTEEYIQRVTIYHQPGAGGTTVGRQMLWDFRKSLRCCVVKKITTQTCSQICKLREYEDAGNPNPILVLLDNHDDDKITELYESLSEMAKECTTTMDVFCILLLCCRRPVLPFEKSTQYIMLKQQLSLKEKSWLKDTHKDLMKKFKANKGCDPKYLISFNIMKENFNQDCIDRTIKQFVRDEQLKPNDLVLLKYMAFFNTYDLKKKAIPTACFDQLFGGSRIVGRSRWEQRLCQSTRFLLLHTKLQGMGGDFQGFRVVHSLLSKPLLDAILEVERGRQHTRSTIGEVAMEILNSGLFSGQMSFHKRKIFTVLRTIVKKRKWREDLEQLELFSPLILELRDMKDFNSAVTFSIAAFEITLDSGIAQQVSRLFIDLEDWSKANDYVQEAIRLSPNNSSYWHTKGQIFKKQVQVIQTKYRNKMHIPHEDIERCIRLTMEASETYQKVQSLSLQENAAWKNYAGHDGEITTSFRLIEVLQKFDLFSSTSHIKKILNGDVSDVDIGIPRDCISFLQGLGKRIYNVIDELQDVILQADMKPKPFYSQTEVTSQSTAKQIENFRETFNSLVGQRENEFGRDSSGMTSEQRRRLIRGFGATKLRRILQMRSNEKEKLQEVLNHVTLNIKEDSRPFDINDWKIAISAILALHDWGHDKDEQKWQSLIEYSRKLYDTHTTYESKSLLEAHLLVCVIHWPLESRSVESERLLPPFKVADAISTWRSHVENLPRRLKQEDRSIVYLTKRKLTDSIVLDDDVKSHAVDRNLLQTFTGKLVKNGEEVVYELIALKGKNCLSAHIKVDKPIKQSHLWQRKVQFYLGFGFHGPRAHVIIDAISDNQKSESAREPCVPPGSYRPITPQNRLPTLRMQHPISVLPFTNTTYRDQGPYQSHSYQLQQGRLMLHMPTYQPPMQQMYRGTQPAMFRQNFGNTRQPNSR